MSCLLNPFMLAPAGTPYRYWRLTAADVSWGTSPSSHSWSLWDLELFEAPDTTGADLTTGATASTNSGGAGSEGPERAIDGNLATSWTTATAVGWGAYIQVDLGVARVVRSLSLTARDLSLSGLAALPKSITLAGSADGSAWTTVATLTTAPTHNVRQVYSNIMAGATVAAAVSGPLDLSNGAQTLLVPAAGVSVITVPMLIGAGGEGTYHLANTSGGRGAALACTVPVSPGDRVTFVAGTRGTNEALAVRYGGGGASQTTAGWGGGCSYVLVNGDLRAVAGGGGGGSGFAGQHGGSASTHGYQGGGGGVQSTAANGVAGGGGSNAGGGAGAGSGGNPGAFLWGGAGGTNAAGGGGGKYGGGGGGNNGSTAGAGGGGSSDIISPATGTIYGLANLHPQWDGDSGWPGYDPFADHSNQRTPGGHGRIKASW